MRSLDWRASRRPWIFAAVALMIAVASSAALVGGPTPLSAGVAGSTPVGIHKIQHVIVIMQENRSFDSYFGTYPGADGIPMSGGVPTTCVPNPQRGTCVAPYHDPHDKNGGGPHGFDSADADIDHGKMDGFIAEAERGAQNCAN